jgi:hypothetical protein
VRTARRYELAVRLYPVAWRRLYGDDLLSTLAELDRERGRASTREVAALVCGAMTVRCRPWSTVRRRRLLTCFSASMLLCAAASPAGLWSRRVFVGDGSAVPMLAGPAPTARLILAGVCVATLCLYGTRSSRRPLITGAAVAAAELAILVAAQRHATGPPKTLLLSLHMVGVALLIAAAATVAAAAARRLGETRRTQLTSGALIVASITAAVGAAAPSSAGVALPTLPPWQLGPAGWLTGLGVGLAVGTLLASSRVTGSPQEA